MSVCYWGSIEIGGALPSAKLNGLLDALDEDCLIPNKKLDDTLKKFTNDSGCLHFEESQAPNGYFPNVEEFCKKNGLSYVNQSEDSGELDAGYGWYINGEEGWQRQNKEGAAVVKDGDLTGLLNSIDSACEKIKTIEDAPRYINDEDEVIQYAAKYTLEHKTLNPYVIFKQLLNKNLLRPCPDLPKFEII